MSRADRNFMAFILGFFILGLILWVFGARPSQALADPLGSFQAFTQECTDVAAPIMPSTLTVNQKARARSSFKFVNGAQTIYVGGPDVDTTDLGFPVAAGATLEVDGSPGVLYCITAAAGSSDLEVLAGTK